jgi:hypothetical protein
VDLYNYHVLFEFLDTKEKLSDELLETRQIRTESKLSARRRFSTTSSDKDHEEEEDLKAKTDVKSVTKRLKKGTQLKNTNFKNQNLDLKREGATEQGLFSILKYSKPEWHYLFFGLIASTIQGSVFPAFSIFFAKIMDVFAETDTNKMRHDGHNWALMFVVLAIIQWVTQFIQVYR